jgi:hypothetical protein
MLAGLVGWIIFTLSWSSARLVCVPILQGAEKPLYRHNEQFLDHFDFDDREDIFLHAAIREIKDLSGEEVVAVQIAQDFHGVGVVDIADFEMDALIDPVHTSHPLPR